MEAISRFTFEKLEGPEEKWPLRSRLLDRGNPTRARLTGHVLRHQFEVPGGYLFISNFDCPMEETHHLTLVGGDYRVLSRRFIGWAYCNFLLEKLHWLDPRHLELTFDHEDVWRLTIRPWGIPFVRPRLGLRRLVAT